MLSAASSFACIGGGGPIHAIAPEPVAPRAVPRAMLAVVVTDVGPIAETTRRPRSRRAKVSLAQKEPASFPAKSYGSLDKEECKHVLDARRVPYRRVKSARGVDTPIRLTGPLHGVEFHGDDEAHRGTSPFEILDCRLALALDDFAAVLAAHDVREAVHMSMYRPPTPPLDLHAPTRQHAAGLAIDLGALIKSDGSRLVVVEDFHGQLGAKTCGDGASPSPATARATELRDLLCTTVDAQTFHLVLTPNHDAPHHNHFHLEVMRDTSWTMVE